MLGDKDNIMARPDTIRVIIVDDHELLRSGIRFALLSIPDIELVGEARYGADALSVCAATQPDVVLMDILLPGEMDGVAATRAIRTLYPATQVLGLSSYVTPSQVQTILRAGAIGYLAKDVSIRVMADAIRAAKAGVPTMTPDALAALIAPAASLQPAVGGDLSPREREVLTLLVGGKANIQIAEQLVVSVAAVKFHVSSILSKLGAANRTEAAALAREHGLVATPDAPTKS
jgi:NarL family two-component system response regulator LiaR